jgi:hypothetical protein
MLPPQPQPRCPQATAATAAFAAATSAATASATAALDFVFIVVVVAATTAAVLPPRFHCRRHAAADALARRCRVGWSFWRSVSQLVCWLVGRFVGRVGQ